MSFAWSAVVVLVLFLPGFLFFVGISLTERFTREPLKGGTLGQFSGVLLVSLLAHGSLLLLLGWDFFCETAPGIRCLNLELILDSLWLAGGAGSHSLVEDLAQNIEANTLRIFIYLLVACTIATVGGVLSGLAVVSRKARVLAKHRWAYILVPDESFWEFVGRLWRDFQKEREPRVVSGFFANVVTKIQRDQNVLVYRGEIADYGVSDDGFISYLALENPERCYLRLPNTVPARLDHRWHTIGSSASATGPGKLSPESGGRHIFLVEREAIEQVVFTSAVMVKTPEHDQLLADQTEPVD